VARQVKLKTREMGDLHLMLVRSVGGEWEPDWAPLKGSPYEPYLTITTHEIVEHALHGWTSPLVKALGYAPKLVLHRLSPDARQCAMVDRCLFYRKRDCLPNAKNMPNCYEPRGVPSELGYEIIRLWRESVYVVVVEEPA
jgi:hypothetical protein